MDKQSRSISKINDDIKSAGQSFLGQRMEDLLVRFNELDDKVLKSKLVEEYFMNQLGYFDKDINGTRTRVNAAIRIIKSEQVIYALEQIDGLNLKVQLDSVLKAKETLSKIRSGILILPNLD